MSISGFFKKLGSQIKEGFESAADKIKAEARRFDDRIIQPVIKPIVQVGLTTFVGSIPIVGGILGGLTSSIFGGPEMAIDNRVLTAGPATGGAAPTVGAPPPISPTIKTVGIVAAVLVGGLILFRLSRRR